MVNRRSALACLATLSCTVVPVQAQSDYPVRPIRLVVASAAGSTADVLARVYADQLKTQMGQPVVVENKPGATGAIGADAVAKAAGDGYTLLLHSSALAISPWMSRQPFDFRKDLTPVARTAETPYLLTVSARLPVETLQQFIEHARAHPGVLSCGTYGIGSPPHLALELLKKSAGIDVLHVPYKTSAQSMPELFAGQLACVVEPPPGSIAHIPSGRVRVIAHTGVKPMAALPDAEPIGRRHPAAAVTGWQAVFAPSATPAPVLERLRSEWALVVSNADVQRKIREAGLEPVAGPVEEFEKTIDSDYRRFGEVVREAGIRAE